MRNKLLFLIVLSLSAFNIVYAEDLAVTCNLNTVESQCKVTSETQCRQLLEKCEKYYSEESAKIEQDINKTSAEKNTLKGKIRSLNRKVNNLSYQISQSNVIIKDLGYQIEDTTESIVTTKSNIEEQKDKLAVILRAIQAEDQKPIAQILLTGDSLSGFFDNLLALELLDNKNKELLTNIKSLKINLEDQKVFLGEEKQDLENIVQIQQVQKSQNSTAKKQQESYLKITEQEYNKQVQEKQEIDLKASEIRSRLFAIVGIEDSRAPTFGEAYEIAKGVESILGIRPAFLLAVLTQESNLGKNVGQCYLTNADTGAGIVIKTGKTRARVMKPTRDVSPFIIITKELGRDPFKTPVSCPMSYGWGGAMGPAQFIPKTWMGYRDRLRDISGRPADPWSINDAFLAAGLYLTDYGAKKQTYNGEFNAALSYFAGPSWYKSRYKKVYERDYGNPIMAITKRYQADIDKIQ